MSQPVLCSRLGDDVCELLICNCRFALRHSDELEFLAFVFWMCISMSIASASLQNLPTSLWLPRSVFASAAAHVEASSLTARGRAMTVSRTVQEAVGQCRESGGSETREGRRGAVLSSG